MKTRALHFCVLKRFLVAFFLIISITGCEATRDSADAGTEWFTEKLTVHQSALPRQNAIEWQSLAGHLSTTWPRGTFTGVLNRLKTEYKWEPIDPNNFSRIALYYSAKGRFVAGGLAENGTKLEGRPEAPKLDHQPVIMIFSANGSFLRFFKLPDPGTQTFQVFADRRVFLVIRTRVDNRDIWSFYFLNPEEELSPYQRVLPDSSLEGYLRPSEDLDYRFRLELDSLVPHPERELVAVRYCIRMIGGLLAQPRCHRSGLAVAHSGEIKNIFVQGTSRGQPEIQVGWDNDNLYITEQIKNQSGPRTHIVSIENLTK